MTQQIRRLVLLTSRFPFGRGESFLEAEIPYLAERFQQVVVIPSQVDEQSRPVLPNVQVEANYARNRPAVSKRLLLGAVTHYPALVTHEVQRRLPALIRYKSLVRALYYLREAHYLHQWLTVYAARHGLQPGDTLLYSYWSRAGALGLGLMKDEAPGWQVVARGLGSDVYEEVFAPPYLPFRHATFKRLDLLATASEHMRRYVLERYPNVNCEVHRMAVRDPGFRCLPSADGEFHLVSCSSLIPLKRVSLLLAGLQEAAEARPDIRFVWDHLGDGPLRTALEQDAAQTLPDNVRWHFHGQVPNREVIAFYRAHPVDLFVNVSSSEGIPVSAMEAQSCGIPVLATAVGGTPELLADGAGILLSANPTPDEVSARLLDALDRRAHLNDLREKSRDNWYRDYNADFNFSWLADLLLQRLDSASAHQQDRH